MDTPFLRYPPAVSKVFFLKTLRSLGRVRKGPSLESDLVSHLGARDAFCCNSWVGALALFLDELGSQWKKSEVILPRYSCFEFTAAVKIAGLNPVYVDVDPDLRMSISGIRSVLSENTLAVLGVNNVGILSDLDSIRALSHGNFCLIEDATYTLFGEYKGRKAATVGDVAILNFSEGKAIPIGGGGMVLNSERFRRVFDPCKEFVQQHPAPALWSGVKDLAIYTVGSRFWVYSVYLWLKGSLDVDLKERLSMEIVRRNPKEVRSQLDDQHVLQKRGWLRELTGRISPIKQLAARLILQQVSETRLRRWGVVAQYQSLLGKNPAIRQFDINRKAYVLRFPILCSKIDEDWFEHYRGLGLSRLYGPDSELCDEAAPEKNSVRFFKNLVTLPVYEGIRDGHVKRIAQALERIVR